jgi:chemotaxis protein MotB
MPRRHIFFIVFWAAFVVSGCVPKKQYLELQTTLSGTQQQLETATSSRDELKTRLKQTEAILAGCRQDLGVLKDRYSDLQGEKARLQQRIDQLTSEIEKQKSLVHLQSKVLTETDETRKQIEASLKDQIASQQVKIQEMADRLKVTFVDKILFDTGSVQIRPDGKAALARISDTLAKDTKHDILVEGHTDNVPISGQLARVYPTNWELSAARATAVVRFLLENPNMAPEKLSATGYAFYHPVASNDTPEGRQQNRRIEIILVPTAKPWPAAP